jgi:hypothetical protein
MKTKNAVINQFIIEVTLIDPISKIVNQLKAKEFRDCDIKWLDAKLKNFTEFTCKTLGLEVILPDDIQGKVLNDYTYSQYIKRFSVLLEYFKSL